MVVLCGERRAETRSFSRCIYKDIACQLGHRGRLTDVLGPRQRPLSRDDGTSSHSGRFTLVVFTKLLKYLKARRVPYFVCTCSGVLVCFNGGASSHWSFKTRASKYSWFKKRTKTITLPAAGTPRNNFRGKCYHVLAHCFGIDDVGGCLNTADDSTVR